MTDARRLRLEQMLSVLWTCNREGGCTRADIAQMIGLKKTPHLIGLLQQLVKDGWIVETVDTLSWPHRMRYTPSERLIEWHKDSAA